MKFHLILALSLGGALLANGASIAYNSLVQSDGAITHYGFDEVGGTTAVAAIAGADGTYTGAVNLSAASLPGLGTAADLAGGFVAVPNLGSFSTTSAEVWLQVDALAAGCCTSIASAGSWSSQALHWNLKSDFAFEHAVNGQGNSNTNPGTLVADGTTWFHLVVTQDAGDTITYVNGVAVPDNGVNHAGTLDYGNSNFQIGAWNGGRLLNGRIDEFAIYDSALTPEQVMSHYTVGTTGIPEPSSSLLVLLGGVLALRRRR